MSTSELGFYKRLAEQSKAARTQNAIALTLTSMLRPLDNAEIGEMEYLNDMAFINGEPSLPVFAPREYPSNL